MSNQENNFTLKVAPADESGAAYGEPIQPEKNELANFFKYLDATDQVQTRQHWYEWVTSFVKNELGGRVSQELFFMAKAMLNSRMTNCLKAGHGAVIVINQTVISDGYNGVPRKVAHPHQCHRLASASGQDYNACPIPCLHAETNAIFNAARLGASTQGAVMYVTGEPCLNCAEAIIQAGIVQVNFASGRTIKDHAGLKLLYNTGISVMYIKRED
jgi:dCMP deaminase